MADLVSGDSGGGAISTPTATASPAVTPGSSEPSGAAPTVPTGDQSTVSDEPTGPIPLDRHKAILQAEREKRKALEWAKGVDQNRYRQMSEWYDMADRNPVEFYRRFGSALKQHPTWGEYVRTPQAESKADPEPEPDLMAENGQKVYSADQLRKWQQWNDAKTKAELQGLVNPLLQREQQSQMQAQAQDYAKRWLDELSGLDGFEELRPEIARRLREDRRLSPLTAYKRAYEEVYRPKAAQASREKLLAEMNEKAKAGTANPNTAGATPKNPREMSWEEALRYYHGRAGGTR